MEYLIAALSNQDNHGLTHLLILEPILFLYYSSMDGRCNNSSRCTSTEHP